MNIPGSHPTRGKIHNIPATVRAPRFRAAPRHGGARAGFGIPVIEGRRGSAPAGAAAIIPKGVGVHQPRSLLYFAFFREILPTIHSSDCESDSLSPQGMPMHSFRPPSPTIFLSLPTYDNAPRGGGRQTSGARGLLTIQYDVLQVFSKENIIPAGNTEAS
jgi:hypothetical protein